MDLLPTKVLQVECGEYLPVRARQARMDASGKSFGWRSRQPGVGVGEQGGGGGGEDGGGEAGVGGHQVGEQVASSSRVFDVFSRGFWSLDSLSSDGSWNVNREEGLVEVLDMSCLHFVFFLSRWAMIEEMLSMEEEEWTMMVDGDEDSDSEEKEEVVVDEEE